MPILTALVPVYNEHEALPIAVNRLSETLPRIVEHWEILLIESGSTDGTNHLCDELATGDERIRVIHEGSRNGFGSAIRCGFAGARGMWIWIVPADLPFPLGTIGQALEYDADAVVSYRSHDRRSVGRRIQSAAFNALARTLFGLNVRSVNSAFKLYRKQIVATVPLVSNGWLIDAEILFRLSRAGARIVEIPVPLVDRSIGASKIGPLDALRILVQLVRLKYQLRGSDGC